MQEFLIEKLMRLAIVPDKSSISFISQRQLNLYETA